MRSMTHPSTNPKARVFFALWPTAAERRQLSTWQKPLHKLYGGRAMRGETLHNTLVFIGNVELSRLEALQLAAQEVGGQRFKLCFDTAQYWAHNRIVYAAPADPPQQLVQLVDKLQKRLAMHGFEFDQRTYQPHVTLLRNTRWSDEAMPRQMPQMQPVCWQAVDFALVQAVSRDGLASYEVLARFPLRVG